MNPTNMELVLRHQQEHDDQIEVRCNGQFSHSFDLRCLHIDPSVPLVEPPHDPVAYGKCLYAALFLEGSAARSRLEDSSSWGYVALTTADEELDGVPWEYTYGPDGFLVLRYPFVRRLPSPQRIAVPELGGGLHIVALPSHPLDEHLQSLNIDGEWTQLKELIEAIPAALTLERVRPPTLEQLRHLLAGRRNLVVHFMGHGNQREDRATLCFEQDNGSLDEVTAEELAMCVRDHVFLLTLNACKSAAPDTTYFSNLVSALVRRCKVAYGLGMRFALPDDAALDCSRILYSELAHGSSVEEAVFQARLRMARYRPAWIAGVPVLYTSLAMPAVSFTHLDGSPRIEEHQPHLAVDTLSRAETTFVGRTDKLRELGSYLTGARRPPLVTIHGVGGQGKTTLAREATERFAFAWPGGVWAINLENLPTRSLFVRDLARFLSIGPEIGETPVQPDELEQQVVNRLCQQRTLLVLDNADTLIEAVEDDNKEAIALAQFIRERLPRASVGLLATARRPLKWSEEQICELNGLSPPEGAQLFCQNAPQRFKDVTMKQAAALSQQIAGHPLSLRLLGSTFNASTFSFEVFLIQWEAHVLEAQNKYVHFTHRHRTLQACLALSVRSLSEGTRILLSRLWLFHAPFLPETAVAVCDLEASSSDADHSPMLNRLYTLWQRSLLTSEATTLHDGIVQMYRVPPVVRAYIEEELKQVSDEKALETRFGHTYAELARSIVFYRNSSATLIHVAQQARDDFYRGTAYIRGKEQADYLRHWGEVLSHLGELQSALTLYQQALSIQREVGDRDGEGATLNDIAYVHRITGQSHQALNLLKQSLLISRGMNDLSTEAILLNNMAEVYRAMGELQSALTLYQQALSIQREVGNRDGEGITLNNIGLVYKDLGELQEALNLFQQALPVLHEVDNRRGEGGVLSNIGLIYQMLGQPQEALNLFQQALPISREVGDRDGEATILSNIGVAYGDLGQLQKALALYQLALPILRQVGNHHQEVLTLYSIAYVYEIAEEPQEALGWYEQALSIQCEANDRRGEAEALNHMGVVYDALGELGEALSCFEQALSIRQEVGDHSGEATTLKNVGEVYQKRGQRPEALNRYQRTLSILRELDDRRQETETLNSTGKESKSLGELQNE